MRGGSVASDAVTSLVSSDTFAMMNKAFSNDFIAHGGKARRTKRRVGGSLASDSVTSLVSKGTYASMDKVFTNAAQGGSLRKKTTLKKKVGGSQASQALVNSVNKNVFDTMSKTFTNLVQGGKKMTKCLHCGGSSHTAKSCVKHGGFMNNVGAVLSQSSKETFSQGALLSNAGNVYQKFDARLPGNSAKVGGSARGTNAIPHLSEFNEKGSQYKVMHKKHGGNSTPMELNYKVNFNAIDNSLPARNPMTSESHNFISGMSATSLSEMAPKVVYGAIQLDQPFSFGQKAGMPCKKKTPATKKKPAAASKAAPKAAPKKQQKIKLTKKK
jgi:hypothetical protein